MSRNTAPNSGRFARRRQARAAEAEKVVENRAWWQQRWAEARRRAAELDEPTPLPDVDKPVRSIAPAGPRDGVWQGGTYSNPDKRRAKLEKAAARKNRGKR